MSWTDETIESLKALRRENAPFEYIAKELNKKYGTSFTRNAVIGKAARIGLVLPTKKQAAAERQYSMRPIHRGSHFVFADVQAPADNESRQCAEDIPPSQRKTFFELTSTSCRFPFGLPGRPEFFFCGGDASFGAYCEQHYRVTHNQAPFKKG